MGMTPAELHDFRCLLATIVFGFALIFGIVICMVYKESHT
jgi:hypothetical protein